MIAYQMAEANSPKPAAEDLQHYKFTPRQPHQMASIGFVPPLAENNELLHKEADFIFLRVRRQEAVIPSDEVNDRLALIEREFVETNGEGMPSKLRAEAKEDIISDMLPRAFNRSKFVSVYFDLNTLCVFVDTDSARFAEDVNALIRGAIGSLPVRPWSPSEEPDLLTSWADGDDSPYILPPDVELGGSIKLQGSDGQRVTFKDSDLLGEDVQALIADGFEVTDLALYIHDRVTFTINHMFHLKQFKLLDIDNADELPSYLLRALTARSSVKTLLLPA